MQSKRIIIIWCSYSKSISYYNHCGTFILLLIYFEFGTISNYGITTLWSFDFTWDRERFLPNISPHNAKFWNWSTNSKALAWDMTPGCWEPSQHQDLFISLVLSIVVLHPLVPLCQHTPLSFNKLINLGKHQSPKTQKKFIHKQAKRLKLTIKFQSRLINWTLTWTTLFITSWQLLVSVLQTPSY